jgi:hypothetical protein
MGRPFEAGVGITAGVYVELALAGVVRISIYLSRLTLGEEMYELEFDVIDALAVGGDHGAHLQ